MLRLLLRKLRRLVEVLTIDENAARRWLSAVSHGGSAFFLSSALTVFPFADVSNPVDVLNMVRGWSKSDWVWRFVIAAIFAIRGMIRTRAPNLTIDEIHAALAARGALSSAASTKGSPP